MAMPTMVFLILAVILFLINLRSGRHWEGLRNAVKQFIAVLPVILLAMLLARLLEILIPEEFIKRWLSQEAGFTGIILGTFGGMLMAFGPYASYPIIATIYHAGAGLGTTIALLAGWTYLGLSRIPFESSFLGLRFTFLRMTLGLIFTILAGVIAHLIELLF